jgi:hypothetical protein
MSSTLSSLFTTVPSTSHLEVVTQVQYPSDFLSTSITISTDTTSESDSNYHDVDWSRLLGYERAPMLSRRQKSWIYSWGWRIYGLKDSREYWLCRLCYTSPIRPLEPDSHLFKSAATSSAVRHLRSKHRINYDGEMPIESIRSGQTTLDAIYNITPRTGPETFDFDQFKALLLRLFTSEQLPFNHVQSEAFRDLLIYCQPRLLNIIPSRRSIRRYIGVAYQQSLQVVKSELQQARTRINLSFDLWTSPGRRLSLLGVTVHYLDANYKPQNVLLALPRMYGSHTANNLTSTLLKLLQQFDLQDRFGHAIVDNASENTACLNQLSEALDIDLGKRHVRCIGHIINLVAHEVLFGESVEAFEDALEGISAAEAELRS